MEISGSAQSFMSPGRELPSSYRCPFFTLGSPRWEWGVMLSREAPESVCLQLDQSSYLSSVSCRHGRQGTVALFSV